MKRNVRVVAEGINALGVVAPLLEAMVNANPSWNVEVLFVSDDRSDYQLETVLDGRIAITRGFTRDGSGIAAGFVAEPHDLLILGASSACAATGGLADEERGFLHAAIFASNTACVLAATHLNDAVSWWRSLGVLDRNRFYLWATLGVGKDTDVPQEVRSRVLRCGSGAASLSRSERMLAILPLLVSITTHVEDFSWPTLVGR